MPYEIQGGYKHEILYLGDGWADWRVAPVDPGKKVRVGDRVYLVDPHTDQPDISKSYLVTQIME